MGNTRVTQNYGIAIIKGKRFFPKSNAVDPRAVLALKVLDGVSVLYWQQERMESGYKRAFESKIVTRMRAQGRSGDR